MASLRTRAAAGLVNLAGVVWLALFASAGTLRFWQAWVYWALFVGTSLVATLFFLRSDPGLVESRMKAGPLAERRTSQKLIQAVAGLSFVGLLVVPGLERRLRGASFPPAAAWLGDLGVVGGFAIMCVAMRANSFASSTIEVQASQRVISSGLYGFVRHPLYTGGLLMFAATPLALASWWGFALVPPMCIAITARLLDEERLLARELPGYADYCAKVRSRLIPGVW